MSELTFIGRAVVDAPKSSSPPSKGREVPLGVREWLSLTEAAELAGTPVEELKRAIREGKLRARRRGWVRIHRGDLNEWRYAV